jgi:para-nitrobenzyl esterase
MIHKSMGFLVVLAIVCGSVAIASAGDSFNPLALTESGLVIGTTVNGVNEFLGIPYATPPLGPLRWTPPKPYGLFHDLVLQATQFGGVCPQLGTFGEAFGTEDCLVLNVYTPANELVDDLLKDHGRGLPVMVWIHGGALTGGAGQFYDPTPLMKKGVILVTINYRLGYLGFFAQSALDAEHHLAGNYGLMDQQLALKWVQNNIKGFGGDPDRVTIFGESAGGQSVYANLASPTAAHLFRGAISESGSYAEFQDYYDFIVPLATGETIGTTLVPPGDGVATSVGCSSPTSQSQCLRDAPASAFVLIAPPTIYPFVDGTLLTQTPTAAFASGHFNRVPVISGTNHDEYRYFVALAELDSGSPLTAAGYPHAVYSLFGQPGPPPDNSFDDFVISLYPLSADLTSPSIELGALGTDDIFACPARNADLLLSQHVPTYAYEFNDETAPSIFPPLSFPLGDSHFIEVQYLFDLEGFGITPTFTPEQQELSDTMIGYWTQFAKTSNPNSPGAPTWSQYSVGGSFESLIAPTPDAESDASFDTDHKCSSFWDTF